MFSLRIVLCLLPLLFSACVSTEVRQQRREEKIERREALSLKEGNAERLADFRQTKGAKRKVFHDDAVLALAKPGNFRIQIILDEQRGILWVRDLVGYEFPVSTGRKGHRTPTGEFKIIAKELKHRSNLYGRVVDSEGNVTVANADFKSITVESGDFFEGAPMPNFMRLTNDGVGMHIGHLPGYAASHGCIRMPSSVTPKIYEMAPIGTPVSITQTR